MSGRPKFSKFKLPAPLQQGDTVALISPASPVEQPTAVEDATRALTKLGLEVRVGKSAEKRTGFIAGSDRERLNDLVAALKNKRVKAVWCLRGGYGTGRILAAIDPLLLGRSPKFIVGCSDITALHALAFKSKTVSLHGPMPNGLTSDGYPDFTWNRLVDALRGSFEPLRPIRDQYPESAEGSTIRTGRTTGRLVGGNLAILCSLLGTPFFPNIKSGILYLEEIGESPYRIDRMLTQLDNAGVLRTVSGIALGTFKNCEYKPGQTTVYRQTLMDVLKERLYPLKVPVFYGLPFGHTRLNATIPNGAVATLDAGKGVLSVD